VDPPSNWVQNANDPPWWATFPPVVKPENYPSYLASRYMGFRPQRSVRMLDSDSSITWDEFLADANSTRLELADRLLDDLLPVASASQDQQARNAAAILQSWDRTADSASAGGPLFAQWWREYLQRLAGRSPFAVPWSESAPRTTPDGLADTALAVSALSAAADTVAARFGQANVAWGQAYRFRRDSVDYAASGASGELGAFRVVNYGRDADGKFIAYGGDSYMAAIEFATPVRAVSLVTYGNASRDGSPHRTDQLPLFANKQFKPVWRSRDDVILHMELRETF
jgi:acyl-homoserine-lactone acylase